jgi:hypothetical protein
VGPNQNLKESSRNTIEEKTHDTLNHLTDEDETSAEYTLMNSKFNQANITTKMPNSSRGFHL